MLQNRFLGLGNRAAKIRNRRKIRVTPLPQSESQGGPPRKIQPKTRVPYYRRMRPVLFFLMCLLDAHMLICLHA